jgi:membrane protease subunit HflC
MKIFRYLLIGIVALGFLAANLVFFQVDATEYAIVTQFGNPVRTITAPVSWLLIPSVEYFEKFSNRIRYHMQIHHHSLHREEYVPIDNSSLEMQHSLD